MSIVSGVVQSLCGNLNLFARLFETNLVFPTEPSRKHALRVDDPDPASVAFLTKVSEISQEHLVRVEPEFRECPNISTRIVEDEEERVSSRKSREECVEKVIEGAGREDESATEVKVLPCREM